MENSILKPLEIREAVIKSGEEKAKIKLKNGIILGILAGAFIAAGGSAAAVASHSVNNVGLSKLVSGIVFPVGIILVLICGAELFTGNNLMSIPVLEGRIKFKAMLRNWIIIYISNFIGATIISFLIFRSGMLDISGGQVGATLLKVASNKSGLSFSTAFTSGIMCNIIVCLAVWASYAAKDIVGKIVVAWFPIMAFVVCGFEHCVANMYYLTIAMLAKTNVLYVQASGLGAEKLALIGGKAFINNLIPVTLGNIVGGAILIGGAYFLAYRKDK
ncbi:formate/nitrite transporter family protein [Haloimpatiens lingqiaonensis]|uniref:formate/nitrite transporter family protein n=1 Tax=Haloimpatiens lingqiaonensis TaxID=1380675 RepID=UPI0010FE40C6|nr:formate/nitrite transporter family protein [Haloimpatiens lingqiaonensis]